MNNTRFIFFGSPDGISQHSYSDIFGLENVTYIPGIRSRLNPITYLLFRLHFMNVINRIFPLPFKTIWAKYLLRGVNINNNCNLVCFFQRGWPEYERYINIIHAIRRKHPKVKTVVFFEDLFKTYYDHNHKPLSAEFIRNTYDLALSFDMGDCSKYNFQYYPLVFSKYQTENDSVPLYDVYFVGKAKDRLSDILAMYEYLKSNGLKCDFHIAGVNEDDRRFEDEIDYNPHISYNENLQHILNAKCILDIMQGGGQGYTQRYYEALGLNKMLLTNNLNITKAPYYNHSYILSFNDTKQLDNSIADIIKNCKYVDYGYNGNYSPLYLLNYLNDYFYKN